jgi:adenylylsulfate kinase
VIPNDSDAAGAGSIVKIISECDGTGGELVSVEPCADPQQPGLTVWFTGLSGAGKTTICKSVHAELMTRGYRAEMLDADVVRRQFWPDLGFSKADRDENIRRIGFLAQLLTRNGIIALVAAISPYRAARGEVRSNIPRFLEVHVDAPLHVCEERDPKGLYKRARAGDLRGFNGIDDPYEVPLAPEVRCATDHDTVNRCRDQVVSAVLKYLS